MGLGPKKDTQGKCDALQEAPQAFQQEEERVVVEAWAASAYSALPACFGAKSYQASEACDVRDNGATHAGYGYSQFRSEEYIIRERRLTDSQIVRAVAENVMGWTEALPGEGAEFPYFHIYKGFDAPYAKVTGVCDGPFNFYPLDNDTDACQVLDKMASEGYLVELTFNCGHGTHYWTASFCKYMAGKRRKWHGCLHEDRRRAICLSALKALGVDVE